MTCPVSLVPTRIEKSLPLTGCALVEPSDLLLLPCMSEFLATTPQIVEPPHHSPHQQVISWQDLRLAESLLSGNCGYGRFWGVGSLDTKRCVHHIPTSPARGCPLSHKNHCSHHFCYHKCNNQFQIPLECLRALFLGTRIFSIKISSDFATYYTLYIIALFKFCLLPWSRPLWLFPLHP